jgi:hypothetical protein
VGFVISTMHFLKRGVPLAAIGHAQYVSAALLFLCLTFFPSIQGYYVARQGSRVDPALPNAITGKARVAVRLVGQLGVVAFGGVVADTALTLAAAQLGGPARPLKAWWFAIYLLSWGRRALELRRAARGPGGSPEANPWSGLIRPAGSWVLLMASFAALVYPMVPQWVGGGLPRPVQISWVDGDPMEELLSPYACRQAFEVLADEHFLYLAEAEQPPAPGCDDVFNAKDRWFPLPSHQVKYAVVPRSAAARMVYEQPPRWAPKAP